MEDFRLYSKNFILRPFKAEDAERVAELCNDKTISDNTFLLPYPYRLTDAVEWIDYLQKSWDLDRQITLAICRKDDQELIGCISLDLSQVHRRATIGYWLGSAYRNQGIMTECLMRIMTYVFDERSYNKVYGEHYAHNPASGKVMEKAGLKYEGTLKGHYKKGDAYIDLVCYGLTKDDYDKFSLVKIGVDKMYGIEILEREHENILNFTNILEEKFINILDGKDDIDLKFFEKAINFIRVYADGHHHKKEEDILFKYMLEDLGDLADKLIRSGMLVEHALARFTTLELEKALKAYKSNPSTKNKLDIIGHGMAYVYLLRRHAEKENQVLYPFAAKNLSKERLDLINEESKAYEETFNKDLLVDFEIFLLD